MNMTTHNTSPLTALTVCAPMPIRRPARTTRRRPPAVLGPAELLGDSAIIAADGDPLFVAEIEALLPADADLAGMLSHVAGRPVRLHSPPDPPVGDGPYLPATCDGDALAVEFHPSTISRWELASLIRFAEGMGADWSIRRGTMGMGTLRFVMARSAP